jgi:hypothetical protein
MLLARASFPGLGLGFSFGLYLIPEHRFLQFFEAAHNKLDQLVGVADRLRRGADCQADILVYTGKGHVQAAPGWNDRQALKPNHRRAAQVQLALGANHIGDDQVGTGYGLQGCRAVWIKVFERGQTYLAI